MKLVKIKNKRLLLIISLGGVLAAGGLAYLWFWNTTSHNSARPANQTSSEAREVNDVDYSPPTDEDKKEQNQQKEDIIDKATGGSTSTSDINVSISRASQAGPGQALAIRTIVTGASTGSCDVTLTKEGRNTIAKSFSITTEATYSTCKDAQIAADDIAVSGTWQLQVVARNGSSKSQPATINVTVNK